jgi:uncharacterized protein (TIGR02145 family)
MAENLNYAPPSGNSWCYGGDSSNCKKYGRLYDWEAAMAACPSGWHLPTREDWDSLSRAAGGATSDSSNFRGEKFIVWDGAGSKLKSKASWVKQRCYEDDDDCEDVAGCVDWCVKGIPGTDNFGFSALPGGYRDDDEVFYDAGELGGWWTATGYRGGHAYYRYMRYRDEVVNEDYNRNDYGYSVRCVHDDAPVMYTITLKAGVGGIASAAPVKASYKAGERVTISAVPNRGYAFVRWVGGRVANDIFAATAVTADSNMTITAVFRLMPPPGAYGTLADGRDGQKYRTARIGGQTWMAENLDYLPTKGKSWCNDNDNSNCHEYGRLYDWAAAMAVCPSGWHLPTEQEWDELVGWVNLVGGGRAGDELKAAGGWWSGRDARWDGGYKGGTDDYGFSALPGGRRYDNRFSESGGYNGHWWTATEARGGAYQREIDSYGNDSYRMKEAKSYPKDAGLSVRCVMDEDTSVTYTLSLKTVTGGTASAYPRKAFYSNGKTVTLTAIPKSGYQFSKWTGGPVADSASAVTAVTMNSNMAITANFKKINYGILTDTRDGRTYKTVLMPDGMAWMAENLNYQPPSGNSWPYMNSTSYSDKSGRLYDWYAAKEACPAGWHLPSLQEWDNLSRAAGGKRKTDNDGNVNWTGAGKKMKTTGNWGKNGDGGGTDDYGFSALPGGYLCGVDCYGGGYNGNGEFGSWWTDAESDNKKAHYRRIFSNSANVDENNSHKSDGHSVRCVAGASGFAKAKKPAAYSLTVTAGTGGTASANSGKAVYKAGEKVKITAAPECGFAFVKWTGGHVADSTASTTAVTVNANTTVAAKFTRVTPHIAHGPFTDARDGKTYRTAQICKYVWMAENLNHQTSSGSKCYDDDTANCDKYGRLYDWETANNACPPGWHLASDKEWRELVGYANGWKIEVSEWGVGGKRLKAKSGWKKHEGDRKDRSGNGTDDFGFSALPGGGYDSESGFFRTGKFGGWWTSTASSDGAAYRWAIEHDRDGVDGDHMYSNHSRGKSAGLSARCVSDKYETVPPPAALALKLIAATGGTASANPRKKSYIASERVTVTATPKRGYTFVNWTGGKVDNAKYAVAIVTIDSSVTVTASFKKNEAPPVVYGKLTDRRDGKKYRTVVTGGTVWMAENLNYETPDSSKCYGDSAGNCKKYGRLYTWNAARTACPAGWHLPSRQEWDDLVDAAGGEKKAGAKLKSNSGWVFYGNGWIRTGNGTDDYGFSALPGGYYNGESFNYAANNGYWWTATGRDAEDAYYRKMDESDGKVSGGGYTKNYGMSVRCVMDEDPSVNAPYKLPLTLTAATGGIVSGKQSATSYHRAGKRVIITATPNSGYIFSGWTGGPAKNSANAVTSVTVNANTALTAGFQKIVPGSPAGKSAIEMVFVKGGTFTMGCTGEPKDCYDENIPAHSVTVSDFYIGKYQVTQKQWLQVMKDYPYRDYRKREKGDSLPVIYVGWNDIPEFIERLNTMTGHKYRLPTEAEWEYAARGGAKSKGYKYSGGNNAGDVAWYNENSGDTALDEDSLDAYTREHGSRAYQRLLESNNGGPRAVGTRRPNELGIYDMSGNVWEWCGDYFDDYKPAAQTNPTGPASGFDRVTRGGGWCNDSWGCRVDTRNKQSTYDRAGAVGFRLVRDP